MKYLPIGTTFAYDSTTLQVQATKDNAAICTGCYFSDHYRRKVLRKPKFSCTNHGMICTSSRRKTMAVCSMVESGNNIRHQERRQQMTFFEKPIDFLLGMEPSEYLIAAVIIAFCVWV